MKNGNLKKRFLEDLKKMCDKYSKKQMKDFQAFMLFFLKMNEDFPEKELLECITDGSKDFGIDAIIIDKKFKLIKIFQFKYTTTIGDKPFNKDDINKFKSVHEYLTGRTDIEKVRNYQNIYLKNKLDESIRLLKEEEFKIKYYFVTTCSDNKNVKINIPKDMDIVIVTSNNVLRKYFEWLHGHSPELGEVELKCANLVQAPLETPNAYLININSYVMKEIYKKYGDNLFSRNVRIFLEDQAKPNINMERTLHNQSERFWYFNNGITILSEKVTIKGKESILLKNPQIINGCQTVSIIGESNIKSNTCAYLFAKVIEIGDTMENQELIDGIIEANNRQTRVDERNLKSNHPIQVRLHRDLEELGFFYERKEGQFNKAKAKVGSLAKLELIKNIDLIKANITLVKSPRLAHEKEDLLFSTYFNEVFIESKSYMDYLVPYLVWREIKYISREYRNKKRFYVLGSYHILKLIYDHCSDLRNNAKINSIYKKLENKEPYKDFVIDKRVIKKLYQVAYKKFKKSKFFLDSNPRDFFRNSTSYNTVCDAIPKYLCNEIEELFED